MASPPSSCHHQQRLVDEEHKNYKDVHQGPPRPGAAVLGRTLAARMLMMSIMNNSNEDERRFPVSPPQSITPEEEELATDHHQQQQQQHHKQHQHQEEHQILLRHEVPSSCSSSTSSTPPPRRPSFMWQSEMDTPIRRELIREIVTIINHWKKLHLKHYKKKHLLNPTTTHTRRVRVPKLFPQLFQQLETSLYTSAPTKEFYMDKETLQERLVAVSVRNKCFGRQEALSWSYVLQMGKNGSYGCCE